MRDISPIIAHYRNTARDLWNNGFWSIPDLHTWDSRDHYDQLIAGLFKALVAAQFVETHECRVDSLKVPEIFVIPSSASIPAMIKNPRPGDKNGYWDHPVNRIPQDGIRLRFIEFFDFDYMNYADFQYCRVKILEFSEHPEVAEREALIEHQYVKYFIPIT